MEEMDLSRPGFELFPESAVSQFNSQSDVVFGHDVGDPLDSGVTPDAADQGISEKELNFRALREEVAKMKEEREYWKGQAQAFSTASSRQAESSQQDALSALDWDDSRDVRKAFDAIRQENQNLRREIKDALTAMETKSVRQDWNSMVTQHVPQLTSKNPIFAEMIQNASNPYEAAYLLAELQARASSQKQIQAGNLNSQRAVSNASKPQTLSSVGGNAQLNAADYYASMSDEDFIKVVQKNLANI